MKTCTKCGEIKRLSDFGVHKSTKDRLRHACRPCNNLAANQWGKNNPEKALALARKWVATNPVRRKEHSRKSYAKHKERYAVEQAAAYRLNPDAAKQRARKWAVNNRALVNERSRSNQRNPARRA